MINDFVNFILPHLSHEALFLYRVTYSVVMLLTLLQMLPLAKLFFLTEKYGGYAEHVGINRVVQSPKVFFPIFGIWILSNVLTLLGHQLLIASFLNLVFCYFFFIHQRWNSLLRGAGAPGFMSWWGAVALFLLTLSYYSSELFSWVVLALQIDFAIIMLSAGIYKLTAGYWNGIGMELGMVNPMWGYWWKFYHSLKTNNSIFWVLNQLAWSTEVFAGILMLHPSTRLLGAFLIFGSFAFILTHIRLNFLCHVVIVCTFLFVDQQDLFQQYVLSRMSFPAFDISGLQIAFTESTQSILIFFVVAYTILRPIALLGLYYNFYARKRFPEWLQKSLEKYTNIFGIILWRVFTKEVTNFFIEIEVHSAAGGKNTMRVLSEYDNFWNWRYNHVAEGITVTTLFTALKYFANDPSIFEKRIFRYCETLDYRKGDLIYFRYVTIERSDRFHFIPTFESIVDPIQKTIRTVVLNEKMMQQFNTRSLGALHCSAPGSYAPNR